jgi:hypothetical protein
MIYENTNSIFSLSLLPPFCQDKIHYVHDFQVKSLEVYKDKKYFLFINNLTTDLITLLNNLSDTDNN